MTGLGSGCGRVSERMRTTLSSLSVPVAFRSGRVLWELGTFCATAGGKVCIYACFSVALFESPFGLMSGTRGMQGTSDWAATIASEHGLSSDAQVRKSATYFIPDVRCFRQWFSITLEFILAR